MTGTNGKTSVVHFTRGIWTRLGFAAASLGTLGLATAEGRRPGTLTTPDPIVLHNDLAILAEFSGSDDGLRDEKSLLAAANRASADFVTGVADCRIGIEARLLLSGFCRTNLRLRLAQGRIALGRQPLQRSQRHQRALGLLLRLSHPGVDRFHSPHGHLVLAVLHLLLALVLCRILFGLLVLMLRFLRMRRLLGRRVSCCHQRCCKQRSQTSRETLHERNSFF